MRTRLTTRFAHKPVSTVFLSACALGIAALLLVQSVYWSRWAAFTVHAWTATAAGLAESSLSAHLPPSLAEKLGGREPVIVPYAYRGRTYFARVEIPGSELAISRPLATEYVFGSRRLVRAAYLRTMVSAGRHDPVVAQLCAELQRTRDRLGLDSDEYAELIARFVQQIPYGNAAPRFGAPAVVLADGRAVCADKSVLLATLLAHEGYSAAVVAIDSNNHAATAVRGTGPGYLGSGYAYVETTVDSYVGEVPPESGGAGPVEARTQIVRVSGGRPYRSDLEAQFVGETLVRAKQAARALEPYRRYAARASGDSRVAFASMAERHVEALELTTELRRSMDDRARMYALMTRSGGR